MKNITVTIPVQDKHKASIETAAPDCRIIYDKHPDKELLSKTQILLGNIPAGDIKYAPQLEFLQLSSAGAFEFTQPGIMNPQTRLANATGAYGRSIAEHMLGMALMLLKKLNLYQQNMDEHSWHDEGHVRSLSTLNCLVLGLGDIGSEFAIRMHALGCSVTGIRRNKAAKPDYLDALYQLDMLDELLPKADIVACTLPGTSETYHLFDKNKLTLMKKDSILLNVGRGTLIPSEDLIFALQNGPLGSAGIDVAEEEPLSPDSPLWEQKNLLITPHISGAFHTQDILDSIVQIAVKNLQSYLTGKPLINEVDFQTGYRRFTE